MCFFFATDSLLNPPASCLRPKETLRHPPGRTQGAGEGERGSEGEGERRTFAGREGRQQPERHVTTRDRVSQQASLPERTTSVHTEATAGKCTHTQVRQGVYGRKERLK